MARDTGAFELYEAWLGWVLEMQRSGHPHHARKVLDRPIGSQLINQLLLPTAKLVAGDFGAEIKMSAPAGFDDHARRDAVLFKSLAATLNLLTAICVDIESPYPNDVRGASTLKVSLVDCHEDADPQL